MLDSLDSLDSIRVILGDGVLGRIICIVFVSLVVSVFSAQEPPSSFSKAKKFLADLHEEIGHLKQFTAAVRRTAWAHCSGGKR